MARWTDTGVVGRPERFSPEPRRPRDATSTPDPHPGAASLTVVSLPPEARKSNPANFTTRVLRSSQNPGPTQSGPLVYRKEKPHDYAYIRNRHVLRRADTLLGFWGVRTGSPQSSSDSCSCPPSVASWAPPGARARVGSSPAWPSEEGARFQRCRPLYYGGYISDRPFGYVGHARIMDGRKPYAGTRPRSLTCRRPSPPTPRSPGATGRATGAARPRSTFGTPTDSPRSLRGRACRAWPNPSP